MERNSKLKERNSAIAKRARALVAVLKYNTFSDKDRITVSLEVACYWKANVLAKMTSEDLDREILSKGVWGKKFSKSARLKAAEEVLKFWKDPNMPAVNAYQGYKRMLELIEAGEMAQLANMELATNKKSIVRIKMLSEQVAKGVYEPRLDVLDKSPYIYVAPLNTSPLGMQVVPAIATVIEYARENYDPTLSGLKAESLINTVRMRTKNFDVKELGKLVSEQTGLSMSEGEIVDVGSRIRGLVEVSRSVNPTFAANILRTLIVKDAAKVMKDPEFIQKAVKERNKFELQAWMINTVGPEHYMRERME